MKSSLTSVLTSERTVYGYILRKSQRSMHLALLLTLIPISILAVLALMLEPEDRIIYLLSVAGPPAPWQSAPPAKKGIPFPDCS